MNVLSLQGMMVGRGQVSSGLLITWGDAFLAELGCLALEEVRDSLEIYSMSDCIDIVVESDAIEIAIEKDELRLDDIGGSLDVVDESGSLEIIVRRKCDE